MFNFFAKIILLFSILFFLGCKKNEDSPTQNQGNVQTIQKSSKRGLAYNMSNPSDFEALKSGVSWWYNWYLSTNAETGYYSKYQMEFIPMLWGGNSDNDFTTVKKIIIDNAEIKYLLVLNEPNLTDQANQLPYQAVASWKRYEKLVSEIEATGRKISLVGPAMNWGTMENYSDPVVWLDDFYEAYRYANNGNDPRIDYLAFHWYDYGLASQLDRLKKYGKKIWITEMANWNANINTYEKQADQMTEMVSICESRDDVFRYAWFIGRGNFPDERHTYLFTATAGELNQLGKLYISLPYK